MLRDLRLALRSVRSWRFGAIAAILTLAIGIGAGALGAILSGSGPTALFLAADEQHSLDIAFALSSVAGCADVVQSRGPVQGARLT